METVNLADQLPWRILTKQVLTPREYMQAKEAVSKILESITLCRPDGFQYIFVLGPPASTKIRQVCHVVCGLYGWEHQSSWEGGLRLLKMMPRNLAEDGATGGSSAVCLSPKMEKKEKNKKEKKQ